jgi:hypothetical protein
LQAEILRILAARRDPESFIAGGVPVNRSGTRISNDIDIFHDREERVAAAALGDAQALIDAGYTVRWTRQQPAIYSVVVASGEDETRIEWLADSDFRFFPALKDEEFGYVLDLADLAVNKVMAAASRREPRDLVDLVTLHEQYLPLGAAIWAAVEAAPGFTPEGLIAEIRRNSRYPAEAFAGLDADAPLDAAVVMEKLRAALDDAEKFVAAMPSDKAGALFLKDGKPVQPDPTRLDQYVEHRGRRGGHLPTSPDVARAMLERHKSKR